MKRTDQALCALLFLAYGTMSACARLGEATNEVHARYGEPLGQDVFLGLFAESFTFKGYSVVVVFKDGKSFIEALKPLRDSARIEAAEAEIMAGKLAACGKWTRKELADPPGLEFKGTNGALALLRHGAAPPDYLTIYCREAAEQLRPSEEAKGQAVSNAPVAPKPSVDQSPADAIKRERQEAINGLPAAQCALGKRYLAGDGVPKDEDLARYWLEKAAGKGDAEAKAVLSRLAR